MNGSGLREGLLGAEVASAELERKYHERLRALIERRLTPLQRGVFVFSLMLSLALIAFFVVQFLNLRGHERPTVVVGLALGLAFSIAWGVLALVSLRTGTENLRLHAVVRSILIWLFTALLMGLMLWVGMNSADVASGIRIILFGVVFFVGFGLPYFVGQVVLQSELRMREDLLRLQLILAQLVERGGGSASAVAEPSLPRSAPPQCGSPNT